MIVHHAKKSHNDEVLGKYAPLAAKKAAIHGAHIQAVELFNMAQQYLNDKGEPLAQFYEDFAYECYLTNQTKKAIDIQLKALEVWQELGDRIRIGSSLRVLSRLHWFEGKKAEADKYGQESIKELENGYPLNERAKAYSNYAQLKMLAGDKEQAILFGNKALKLARKINDEEICCHALNNIGTVKYIYDPQAGSELFESLEIGLKNKFQEHVARAYTNIASVSIEQKNYQVGIDYLNKGIEYCQERDLDSWNYYMLSWKARYLFEIGKWKEAEDHCDDLLNDRHHPSIIKVSALAIKGRLLIRKGELNQGISFLEKAKSIALDTNELQRIIPVTIAFLEYAWISKDSTLAGNLISISLKTLEKNFIPHYFIELCYWMNLVKMKCAIPDGIKKHPMIGIARDWKKTSETWKKLNCPFEQAISLCEGDEKSIKGAMIILDQLEAIGTMEFLKSELRAKGIKVIPRGHRESTKSNPAFLTGRQIDVLHQLKKGCTNSEIAENLFISAKTVDHHVTAILSKLNVHSREDAVLEAIKLGVIE